jgi:acyl-CoA dehydrogenase
MYQKIETARLLVWKAAWEADKGLDPTINASIAKFYATETALEVVNEALQILGAYGYTKLFPLEKLLRDIRLLRIYEGTSEIQRIIVSGHAMYTYQPVMPSLEDLPIFRDRDPLEPDTKGKIKPGWRCRMCGYLHHGQDPPEECIYCFFPRTTFKRIWPV